MLILLPPILIMGNDDFYIGWLIEARAWLLQQRSDLVECLPCLFGVYVNTAQIAVSIIIQCNILLSCQDPWVVTAIPA